MKRAFLFFYTLILFVTSAFSQDSLIIKINRKKYLLNDQEINKSDLDRILKNNASSSYEFNYYKRHSTLASEGGNIAVVGVTMGEIFLTYVMLEQKKADSFHKNADADVALIGLIATITGTVFGLVSIPFSISSKHHLKKAIRNFNIAKKSASGNPLQLNFTLNSYGFGLKWSF